MNKKAIQQAKDKFNETHCYECGAICPGHTRTCQRGKSLRAKKQKKALP